MKNQTKQQECECHCHNDKYDPECRGCKNMIKPCIHCQPAKPTESWEDEEVDANVWVATQPNSSTRLKCFTEEGLKQFIAKTLKEHDEKLVAKLEKLRKPSRETLNTEYASGIGQATWNNAPFNQAIDRTIEIVKGGEK